MAKKHVYKRLTIENRMDIQAAIHDGKNISEISRMLSVNKSTISRELNRGMTRGMFCSTIEIIATCNGTIYVMKIRMFFDFKESVFFC